VLQERRGPCRSLLAKAIARRRSKGPRQAILDITMMDDMARHGLIYAAVRVPMCPAPSHLFELLP
jgi:hypothetical protein